MCDVVLRHTRRRHRCWEQVCRDYHAGKKGTFMDDYHHNRYFKDIDYNTDVSFTWTSGAPAAPPPYLFAMKPVYDAYIQAVLTSPKTHHLTSIDELGRIADTGLTPEGGDLVLWHHTENRRAAMGDPVRTGCSESLLR